MINHKFYQKFKQNISVASLLKLLSIELDSKLSNNDIITDINNISEAQKSELCFLSNRLYLNDLKNSKAGFCLIEDNLITAAKNINSNIYYIASKNSYYDLAKVINYFYQEEQNIAYISQSASIAKTATIGNNCQINNNVVIADGVIIGDNTTIMANSYIAENVEIGNNVTIGSNSTITYSKIGNNVEIAHNVSIGQDGFGFVFNGVEHYKIKQLGLVIIENNVSIGSNVSIDRGSMSNTTIGAGTKIDNLVQIAHNVSIGKKSLITAQVGIAGSAKVGDFNVFGGQSGVAGHIKIGSYNRFAAQSGVTKNIPEKSGDFYGMPAQKKKDWQKEKIILRKLIKKNKKNE